VRINLIHLRCFSFETNNEFYDRWAVFSIPAAIWLPGSAGGTTWTGEPASDTGDGKWHIRREIVAAWKRLGGMLRWSEIRALRNTFKYLAAWFLLSDGQCRFLQNNGRTG
jgi:MFS-type transporter involved in bile tolerance (Atg22 family)